MLYLAEIQKQSKGFMGGVETKLKLIACQRNDQSWSIIGNESITLGETNDFDDGALIVVNLGVNRQIQGNIELASQKIIGILKNFSRLLEKTKDQEQEISQWKESLAIQSEELSRRQIEMETRLEQIEQMEEESKQFEQQKQEIAAAKAETDQLKSEFEAKSAELQIAWEQLRGKQQNLAEQVSQSKILDEEQANILKQQLAILATANDTSNLLTNKLNVTAEAVKKQQELLQPHWQILRQSSDAIVAKRLDLERIAAELAAKHQQVSALIESIATAEQQLGMEFKSLEVKQELTRFLNLQSEAQENMLQMLAGSDSDSGNAQKLDIQELENIPLPNLETIVESLKKDLEKVATFVNDQEEELGWQCKAVEELEAKISQVGEFERLTLEQELADEKEAKKMLDQTLVGQRRSLKERHQVLLQHSRVLKRRQGVIDFDFESEIQEIDLEPIRQGLEEQHQKLQQQQQELAEEVIQIEQSIQGLEASLEQQKHQKSQLESEIVQQQDSWNELNLSIVKQQSQIDFYEQQLQPLQDALDQINSEVSEMVKLMGTYVANNPSEALSKIVVIITDLTAT